MTNSPIIEGIPDPRKSSQLKSDDPVDPEKFKRMLKVENSEEMQKQHKRRRPKKTEEEEGPENKEDISNTPTSTSFSDLFNPKSNTLDMMSGNGTKKSQTVSSELSPLADSSIYFLKTHKLQAASAFLKLEGTLPKATKIETHSNFLRKPKKETTEEIPLEALEKSNIELTPFNESASSIENLKKSSSDKEASSLLKDAKESASSNLTSASSLIDGIATPLVPLASEETEAEKIDSLSATKKESLQKEHKEKDKESEDDQSNTVIQQTIDQAIKAPPLLTSETPAYANLSANVYELFEKLIGLLMIEEHKGISITTVKLSMPGSVFHNCEIKLEHFDTAPNSFNIQLLGNPSAIDLFNANYQTLVNAMTQSNFSFKANIRRPILLESYQHLIKRKKEQPFDDSDQEQAS